MKAFVWTSWVLLTTVLAGYFAYTMVVAEDKTDVLIGEASHGHFQIELACGSCHTDAFGGEEVIQEACVDCHQQDLKRGHDSHPMKKFTDPRNADRLEILDARMCITCHTEHQKEQTRAMGVTIPEDYCFHCHQDVLEERESHKDLAFDSCASAGCHNYHDNRALYERFLVENASGPWLKAMAKITGGNAAEVGAQKSLSTQTENVSPVGPAPSFEHWDGFAHHDNGVGCVACHMSDAATSDDWVAQPNPKQCASCHEVETQAYLESKHGMRLAQNLSPVTPAQSELDFAEEALDQGHHCTSCHNNNAPEPLFSSVGACLGCHQDDHSSAFMDSPHGILAQRATQSEISKEEAVTCATCHLPVVENEQHGELLRSVQHNQNDTLRPNEKMIRPVCMSCHSLAFSIDALADEQLIENNFSGLPANHVPSIDWAVERESK